MLTATTPSLPSQSLTLATASGIVGSSCHSGILLLSWLYFSTAKFRSTRPRLSHLPAPTFGQSSYQTFLGVTSLSVAVLPLDQGSESNGCRFLWTVHWQRNIPYPCCSFRPINERKVSSEYSPNIWYSSQKPFLCYMGHSRTPKHGTARFGPSDDKVIRNRDYEQMSSSLDDMGTCQCRWVMLSPFPAFCSSQNLSKRGSMSLFSSTSMGNYT